MAAFSRGWKAVADVDVVPDTAGVPMRQLRRVLVGLTDIDRVDADLVHGVEHVVLQWTGAGVDEDHLDAAVEESLGEGLVVGLPAVVEGHPAVQHVVPGDDLHGGVDLADNDLCGLGQVGVERVELGDVLREELSHLPQIGVREVVGRVGYRLVGFRSVGEVGTVGEPGHSRQVAPHTGSLGRIVQGPALTHEHEVGLAGLLHHRVDLQHGGVVEVPDDLASVDPSLGVTPLDHGLHGVAHLLVEARD